MAASITTTTSDLAAKIAAIADVKAQAAIIDARRVELAAELAALDQQSAALALTEKQLRAQLKDKPCAIKLTNLLRGKLGVKPNVTANQGGDVHIVVWLEHSASASIEKLLAPCFKTEETTMLHMKNGYDLYSNKNIQISFPYEKAKEVIEGLTLSMGSDFEFDASEHKPRFVAMC